MKLLRLTKKEGGRPHLICIPFDKIEIVETQLGSESVYCKVNGIEVIENYYDILKELEEKLPYVQGDLT